MSLNQKLKNITILVKARKIRNDGTIKLHIWYIQKVINVTRKFNNTLLCGGIELWTNGDLSLSKNCQLRLKSKSNQANQTNKLGWIDLIRSRSG